ncbi:hypothetical protein B566_EDAN013078 [Ephemera danica]|nr:hypothetical protein B566_EDAN013078 [Ephemera danica]
MVWIASKNAAKIAVVMELVIMRQDAASLNAFRIGMEISAIEHAYNIFGRGKCVNKYLLLTECENGKFGNNCSLNCSANCMENCNKDSGICLQGCKPGWKGDTCKKECENGKFGNNCSLNCSANCMEYCNKDSGICLQGCKSGWKGDTCKKECDVGYYGIGCWRKCSEKCKAEETCDAISGHCPNGCEEGFIGEKCDSQLLSTISIILISIGALAFVLLGIGLIYSCFWILRLRRERTKSVDINENPALQIGSSLQPTRYQVHCANSVFYDEMLQNETNRESGQGSSLYMNLVSKSARYNNSGKFVHSTSKRSLSMEHENSYSNAIFDQAGSSAQQTKQAISILPGDAGSAYANVLNHSDFETGPEYDYIRFQGKLEFAGSQPKPKSERISAMELLALLVQKRI